MILTVEQIKQMSERVHTANKRWWTNLETGKAISRNVGELVMLCISELSEGLEGDRKNLMDDKLPHRKMLEVELADALIRTLDIIGGMKRDVPELEPLRGWEWPSNVGECLLLITFIYAQAVLSRNTPGKAASFDVFLVRAVERILSLGDSLNLDIMGAYEEKMAYNATRHDHSVEGRKADGGKRY